MTSPQVTRARDAAESRLAPLPGRLTHVRGVVATADALRGHFDVATADCLVAAAWLHDIGYAPSLRVTGFHPIDGAVFARMLFTMGVQPATVQRILRHSSITVTTGTYVEVIEAVQRDALDSMGSLFAHTGDGSTHQLSSKLSSNGSE